MGKGYLSMTDQEAAVKLENHEGRIKTLEKNVIGLQDLIISVKELTISVRNLTETTDELKLGMKTMQEKDGNTWKEVKKYVITTLIGLVLGYLFSQLF